jgi:hypothetical protein
MAKNAFLDWDTTASNNSDIGGIGILGTNAVSNFDDAFRTSMAQLRSGVDGKAVYATKSGNYTAVANDNNAIHYYTATATVSLTAAATLGANWHYTIVANGAAVTIDPNGSETINGSTTLVVPNGTTAKIICDGSNFFTVFKPNPWEFVANVSVSAASSADVIGLAPFRKLRVHGAITLSASNALAYRVSSDNGSSFYSGASDYSLQYISGTATSVGAASAAAAFGNFSNTIDAGTTIHFFAQFENFNVASGDKGINVDTKQRSAGSVSKSVWGNAINLSNAMNALRLLPSVSGTMTGQFSVEGWRG